MSTTTYVLMENNENVKNVWLKKVPYMESQCIL